MTARVARLATNEATARRICDYLAETLDPAEAATGRSETAEGWLVEVYFRAAPDETALRALVEIAAGPAAARALTISALPERDWIAASLAGLAPVGAVRFLVHGSHDRARVPANRIGIEIEAALAFGTGHHGTTRGCLLALDHILKRRPPRRVLDIGTGSGVLAIAAARALHGHVVASDIDRRAVLVARENARANGAGALIEMLCAAGTRAQRMHERGPYDLVFANILLEPLKRLARPVAALVARNGRLVLSGLLNTQTNAALAAYRTQGFSLARRINLDEWTTLVLRR